MSHELRTPLNAVLGWVHLLRTGKLDRETSTRGLESIDRNVRLQAQLTGDLLDVSKALTGQLQLDSHPTTLGDAASQAVAAVESAARAKGVTIDVCDLGPVCRGSRGQDAAAPDRVASAFERHQVHTARRDGELDGGRGPGEAG